jgi:hypothetical protein
LPTPGGPWIRIASALRIQAPVPRVSIRDRSIAGWKAKSKVSSVWPVGIVKAEVIFPRTAEVKFPRRFEGSCDGGVFR